MRQGAPEDDLPELPWVTSATALPDGTDLDDKNHVQTADKAVAASPAVMKPKSYAAVAKASVVTAAPAQPAAVPKLSVAASLPSTVSTNVPSLHNWALTSVGRLSGSGLVSCATLI